MTKTKILLAIFLIFTLVSSCCFATVEPRTSDDTTTSDVSTISETQTESVVTSEEDSSSSWTNGDLYIIDDTVTVSNVVDGNAFIIGKEVTISGEIGGDLFVIAEKLNIEDGYIYSNVFAYADEVIVNGVVYDVYAICNTFNLESNGFIYRDMKVLASNVNINGKVRRNAFISTDNITFADNSSTLIYGDLEYSSKAEISIPDGVVEGEVKYEIPNNKNVNNIGTTILSYILNLLQTLLFTIIITLLLIWLTPKFVERIGNITVKRAFTSLGIGLITPIALIFVSILLLISSVGVQVATAIIFVFIILAFIGNAITSIFFGKLFAKVFKAEGSVKLILLTLLSSIILWAICQIPVIGAILSIIISILGIGTIVINIVARKEKVKEENTEIKE